MSHIHKADQYIRDVLDGTIPACKQVKQACQRHLDDLEKSKDPEYPYYFDPEAGERLCRFAENMVHVKGKWMRQNITLEPWQCFLEVVPFGWKKKKDDYRRFNRCYIEIPRKNAKSSIAAVNGLYMLTADGEGGAEVYCGATSEVQAWEVFGPAKKMAGWAPEFAEHYGVKVNPNDRSPNIVVIETGSKFNPIVGKPGDGSSPHFAIIDEYHEHPTDEQYDTMQTGMGARAQPMLYVITTGGSDTSGPCYSLHQHANRVLDGVIEDDQLFSCIWTIDAEDDWADFEVWKKANPNYGVSIFEDYLKTQHKEAITSARRQNILLCKHLNMWVNAKEAWLSAQEWDACKDESLKESDFTEMDCFVGLDLASSVDIAANVRVYTNLIDDKRHYYVFGKYYLPEKQVFNERSPHYQEWHNKGLLTVTDRDETDFTVIEADITSHAESYKVVELAFDKYQAKHIAQRLTAEGLECVEFPQTKAYMSPAMKEIEAAIKGGRLHHDGNAALTWMVNNVVAKEDDAENIQPVKERPETKIDGAVAMIMAVGRAMMAQDNNDYIEGDLFYV